ncbi:hypothetical protein TNCV_1438651 [Trichonephila clavipes]|nr:hypothetical protein TNCV_1438651 [Trichonephila clavipes]
MTDVVELWVRVLMSLKTHREEELMHVKCVASQSPYVGMVGKLGEWLPAQVPSLSLDRDSKLRAHFLELKGVLPQKEVEPSQIILSPVWRSKLRLTTGAHLVLCHYEFCEPPSDTVRQVA